MVDYIVCGAGSAACVLANRLTADPDKGSAEYAVLVRTDLQGRGLGRALLQQLIDYAATEGIGTIEGFVSRENTKMLALCRELGFKAEDCPEEPSLKKVVLMPGKRR